MGGSEGGGRHKTVRDAAFTFTELNRPAGQINTKKCTDAFSVLNPQHFCVCTYSEV